VSSFLDKLLLGIKQVWRNGTPMPVRPVINLIGFSAVLDNPSLGTTDVYSSTGGSGGGSLLIVENNGSALPIEPSLNFIGFQVVDSPGTTSTNVTNATPAPVVITTSHTLQPGETWAKISPGSATTFPTTPIVGQTLELTTTGFSFQGNPAEFLGNGHNIQDPQDPNNLSGTRPPAASVFAFEDNVTYRFRWDGSVYVCVN
jgi:hypothetical protein